MASNNPRISKSGVTTTGRFPLFSNSPEVQDADPSLVRLVRGNSLSSLYLSVGDLMADDIDMIDAELVDIDGIMPQIYQLFLIQLSMMRLAIQVLLLYLK